MDIKILVTLSIRCMQLPLRIGHFFSSCTRNDKELFALLRLQSSDAGRRLPSILACQRRKCFSKRWHVKNTCIISGKFLTKSSIMANC
jgi:hypothetical protein